MHLKINKSYKCEVTWLDFSPFLGRVTIKEKRAFISPKSMSHSQRHTVFDKYCGQWPEVKTWINTNNECYDCAERNLEKESILQKQGFPGQLSGIPHQSNHNCVDLRKKRGCYVCIGNHNLFTSRFISTYFNFFTAKIDDARKVLWSKEFRKFQVLT